MVVDWYRYNLWLRELNRMLIVEVFPHVPFGITNRQIEAEVYNVAKGHMPNGNYDSNTPFHIQT